MMRRGRGELLLFFVVVSLTWSAAIRSPSAMAAEKRITLELKDTPIHQAVAALFQGTQLNYVLERGITGTVTVSLRDMPIDQALQTMLRVAGLTYRIEDGVYTIGHRDSASSPQPRAETPPVTTPAVPIVEVPPAEIRIEKVPLNFADSFDIAEMLGVDYVESRGASLVLSPGGYGYSSGAGGSYGYGGPYGYGGYGNSQNYGNYRNFGGSTFQGGYGYGGGYGNQGGYGGNQFYTR
jgi:hypothetical protein